MKTYALIASCAVAAAVAQTYPATERKPVTDTYDGGVQVVDDYRWLEDASNPKVAEWGREQLALTRKTLDALPMRAQLQKRLKEISSTQPTRYFAFWDRGAFFAMKRQPPRNQPFIVAMKSPGDTASERAIVDPNKIDAKGTTAIDWFVPSLDGKYVAVSLSQRGSENGSAHVYEVATGKALPDVVPRVQYPTGGGSLAWNADGTGFFYTRYPQGNERPAADANFYQQVYFHKLGTPAGADTYVIGKDFPRIAEIKLDASRDGKYVLAQVANGDGGEYAYYMRDASGQWTKFADYADRIRTIELGRDGRMYALSLKDAPHGKVLAIAMDKPSLASATELVPQSKEVIEAIDASKDRLYVRYMKGGPSELRVFGLDGKDMGVVPTEPISDVDVGGVLDNGNVLVGSQSFVSSQAWYVYSPANGKLVKTKLAGESKVKFGDAQVVREMCASKDGTQVPVNIVMKKGTRLDGSNPTLLTGYGGYGINMRPYYNPNLRVWLDHGGVFAIANLRGGGEFGDEWHLAGNLTKKQNVFDDMIGCAEHLIKRGYTNPSKLAAMGGSTGGLLMGAILTQRPDLFRAIFSAVGIYDMLRVETDPNGAFNTTEFGTVKDPAQFKALYAYSPYHHVKQGTAYPAVLFATGENDGRVAPWHSRKMTALLQRSTSSTDRPILLRISPDTGHGQGTSLSTRVEEDADRYAFLMWQLGMK